MKAVDTNVVVRVITADDPRQNEIARDIVRTGAFITSGVWIETEWVLRSAYRLSRDEISDAFTGLLMTEGIEVGDRNGVWWAIERYRLGADWPDMIHLIDSAELPAFVTFDQDIPAQAGPYAPLKIEVLQ